MADYQTCSSVVAVGFRLCFAGKAHEAAPAWSSFGLDQCELADQTVTTARIAMSDANCGGSFRQAWHFRRGTDLLTRIRTCSRLWIRVSVAGQPEGAPAILAAGFGFCSPSPSI